MLFYGADWWKVQAETEESTKVAPPKEPEKTEIQKIFEAQDKQFAEGYKNNVKRKSKYTRRLGFA